MGINFDFNINGQKFNGEKVLPICANRNCRKIFENIKADLELPDLHYFSRKIKFHRLKFLSIPIELEKNNQRLTSIKSSDNAVALVASAVLVSVIAIGILVPVIGYLLLPVTVAPFLLVVPIIAAISYALLSTQYNKKFKDENGVMLCTSYYPDHIIDGIIIINKQRPLITLFKSCLVGPLIPLIQTWGRTSRLERKIAQLELEKVSFEKSLLSEEDSKKFLEEFPKAVAFYKEHSNAVKEILMQQATSELKDKALKEIDKIHKVSQSLPY